MSFKSVQYSKLQFSNINNRGCDQPVVEMSRKSRRACEDSIVAGSFEAVSGADESSWAELSESENDHEKIHFFFVIFMFFFKNGERGENSNFIYFSRSTGRLLQDQSACTVIVLPRLRVSDRGKSSSSRQDFGNHEKKTSRTNWKKAMILGWKQTFVQKMLQLLAANFGVLGNTKLLVAEWPIRT